MSEEKETKMNCCKSIGIVTPRSVFICTKCGYKEIGLRYIPVMECPKCDGTMKNQYPEFKKVY